jgi:hypothetical protein
LSIYIVLFYLIAGHALVDFSLQSDTIAQNKNPKADTVLQKHVPWYYWLSSHALMHGGMVALITGSVWLGLAETIAHFLIDYFKCKGLYSIHIDQGLHFLCKIIWTFAFLLG